MKIRKCRHKKLKDIVMGWSYICMDCERINIDGAWQTKDQTIKYLVTKVTSFRVLSKLGGIVTDIVKNELKEE